MMKKQRRISLVKALHLMYQAQEILSECAQEEQEEFDNMPEGLQGSDRGQQMEETAYNLQEWADGLEETINELENITEV